MESKNQFANIPKELQAQGRFCCWQYEKSGDRMTKIPYYPLSTYRAQSNNPKTFSDFEAAVNCVEAKMYDGIGLGIFDDVCAIDIDDCVDESGAFSDLALDIIRTMHSYAEYSPSGKGIHILFSAPGFEYDKEQYYIMNNPIGLEVYVAGCTNKYVTVTGNRISTHEFGERTENLKTVLDKYMKRSVIKSSAVNGVNAANGKNTVQGTSAVNAVNAENGEKESMFLDDGMPERAFASKNGEAFRRLWEGDITGYGSQSEADLALCRNLAFWTQKNAGRIDELFRQSGLMREKWDRPQSGSTYGAITIQKAISSCNEVVASFPAQKNNLHKAVTEQAASGRESGTEFLPLIELDEENQELPPFPVKEYPWIIADYVQAVAVHTQTSVDMAATIALGVLAVCLQGKYRIEGSPGYYEPLNLYTVVIADPGERKSSVMSAMTHCLHDYETKYNQIHEKEIRANRQKRRRLELQIAACEEQLKKKSNESMEAELNSLEDQLEEMEKLEPLRLLADDSSVEALTSLLANNHGRIGVVSAEGGTFDNITGRYSSKQNIDVWLKGHCGDPIMIDRLGRTAEKIEEPHLTAVLAIQPYVLGEIMSNEKLTGKGLIARFLFSSPPSMVGKRHFGAPAVPKEVADEYEGLVSRLLSVPEEEGPRTLQMSSDATVLMEQYFAEHEKYLLGEGQAISEWGSKYIGAVLRIAGLLHVASEADSLLVTKKTVEQAIEIGKYFLAHSKYAYSLAGNDTALKTAKYVLGKIKSKHIREIKQWELGKECRSKLIKNVEDLVPALEHLERCGYIRLDKPERKGPGRKPDTKIYVNPLIYEDAVNAE